MALFIICLSSLDGKVHGLWQLSRDLAEYAKLDFILEASLRAEPEYAALEVEHSICRPVKPDDALLLVGLDRCEQAESASLAVCVDIL